MAVAAKGGRYFYAWSTILSDGSFFLPDQALQEYRIQSDSKIILMSGRNTSRGFSVLCKELIPNSPLAPIFAAATPLQNFSIREGQTVTVKERTFCWAYLNGEQYIKIPLSTWEQFGLEPGDRLLCLRATHLGFNNLLEGPYVDQARQVRDILVYE